MAQRIDQDQCLRLLHLLGWSPGETSWRYPDGTGFWQVDARREGQVIIARAPTQGQAWTLAVRMAGEVERGG